MVWEAHFSWVSNVHVYVTLDRGEQSDGECLPDLTLLLLTVTVSKKQREANV